MPRTTELPALGVGLGYRDPVRAELFRNAAAVDFLEITADHFMAAPPARLKELEILREHFPLVPHALDLSLGSAEGIDTAYLSELAVIVRRVEPPWWSEHLAFTRAGGIEIGHLAPLPFNREALDVVSRNVEAAQRAIPVPLILENITYGVVDPGAEMDEAEFLARVVERTGCGLLLDVTNLQINAVVHGYDPIELLERLPLERVVQLHFVGGHTLGGMPIDSHSATTPPEVWSLMAAVLERAPVKGAILERDENFPPFAELAQELRQARELGRRCGRWG